MGNKTSNLPAYRILIVDDEESMTSPIVFFLIRHEYEVDLVSNGYDAFEKLKSESFDLVIMDGYLPVLNGVEVTRQIRKFSQIPIIFLSALSWESAVLEAGANDYMTKPYSLTEVLEHIRYFQNKIDSP